MNNFLNSFQNYKFDNFGYVRLPKVEFSLKTKEELGLSLSASNKDVILAACKIGQSGLLAKNKIDTKDLPSYEKRLQEEIQVFDELYFMEYVALIYKIILKAKEIGIFLDFGRGSCVGSLVFWYLGITGVDPVKNGLFFSRFVSKARAKSIIKDGEIYLQNDLIADADLNLGWGREEIVTWLKQIYPNRVCKILTVSTLTGKVLVKDVYKCVDGASEEQAKEVSDKIERVFGVVEDIEEVYKENKDFKAWADKQSKSYQICLKLRDLIRQVGVHASGYLISNTEISKSFPTQLDSNKDEICSYTMEFAPAVKCDLLGLSTNIIIADVLKNISEKIDEINLEDNPIIYEQFQKGEFLPYGLYQINADCAYKVTNAVKPKNIMELSHVNAIARPGGLSWVDGFVNNKATLPHPIFEKALSWTRNLCLYQESMIQMAMAVGFTQDESEILRRIVGKKKIEQVKEWKEKIYNKVKENNLPENVADILWKILEESASYSFNLSHSLATSYLGALTVYLKYKYPLYWYWACLKNVKSQPKPLEEIAQIERELSFFNIRLLQPNLCKSEMDFTIEDGNIRFGLGSIKGIAGKNIEKLIQFRKPYSNKFELLEAARQAKIPSNILGALIMSGCLDEIVANRPKVLAEAAMWWILSAKEKQLCLSLGAEYDFDLFALFKFLKTANNGEGKPYIKPSRLETIRKHFEPHQNLYLENKKVAELTAYVFEKSLLGYSYSTTLKNVYSKACKELISIGDIKYLEEKDSVIVIGEVIESKTGKSQKGSRYWKGEITDETGTFGVMIFNDKMQDSFEINGCHPKEGDILFVRGQ
jgi:DNA polymerase-3 subunit alpha